MSGELAAQRITDAELAEIKRHALRDDGRLHAPRPVRLLPASTRRSIAPINAAAKNPVLTQTYDQVNARLQALRFRSNQDEASGSAR